LSRDSAARPSVRVQQSVTREPGIYSAAGCDENYTLLLLLALTLCSLRLLLHSTESLSLQQGLISSSSTAAAAHFSRVAESHSQTVE